MDSVNSTADTQSKPPNFGFNFNSSLGNMLNNGSTIDSLFANLLSQTQAPPPSPPPPPPPQNFVSQDNATPNNSSDTDNTNNANNTNNVNSSNSSNSANVSSAPATQASQTSQNSSGWSVAGKPPRQQAKTGTSNNDSNNATGANAGQPPQTLQPADNSQISAGSVTAPSSSTGNSSGSTAQDSTDDTTGNIASATDPASTPAANPGVAADLTLAAAGNLVAPPPVAPVDPSQNANNTNNPVTPDASTPVSSLASAIGQIVAGTGSAPAVDPTTGAAAPSSTNASNNANGADPNAPVSATDPTSQLMALLLQLEQLAASQPAATAVNNNLTVTGDAGQSTSATATPAATGTGADTQNKIDLKALLTAIAGLNSSTATDSTGQNSNPAATDALNLSANTEPTSAAANTALQNGLPVSTNAPAQDAANKLISTDFLSLFSLPTNNTNLPANLPVFNPGAIAGALINNDDGAALNADTQGQNGAGARDAAASLLPDTNSLLPTTGPTQSASPYDFASQLSAMRATQGGATGLPTPVEQVVLQLSRGLAKDGSSQMTIQLRPAELGRVDVKLNIGSDGKVQGTVTADNPATLSLLLKDVRGLERALQEAGLRADSGSLQFGLRGDGQPGGSGQTAGNQSEFDDTGNLPATSTTLPAYTNPVETYYLTPGGVNMRV